MRLAILFSLLAFLFSANGFPQTIQAPPPAVSFDVNAMDRSVNPCTDFYQYACGTWMKNNPIPPDRSRWGRFDGLEDRNLYVLEALLEQAAKPGNKDAVERQVGDFYTACMDENAVNKLGTKPIEADLKQIAAVHTPEELLTEVSRLQLRGTNALFNWGSAIDFHDATQMIAAVDQGGISMPDRDYYIKDEPRFKETREKYLQHVQQIFELAGHPAAQAAAEAKTVLQIETGLANAYMDRTSRRDPHNRDHRMKITDLDKKAPNFHFTRVFTAGDAPKFDSLNVGNPDFFTQVNKQLASIPLKDWKTYLIWKELNDAAPWLSEPFVTEDFRFNKQYLQGTKEIAPRWKRCVELTDEMLGEALGQLYVRQNFGPEAKERALNMIHEIEAAMGRDITQLDWMTQPTKARAQEKLKAVANKIGYPDKWRDYSSVIVKSNDLMGNIDRAAAFEAHREINKIGKPVDRSEWGMTPPTVNAYYSGAHNDINFPAGILQPPFFDPNKDEAVNLGAIGVVIGHELTHGFDDQGRKYDAQGNLTDWWTVEDAKAFDQRAACIDKQYSEYVPVKDNAGEVHLNGKLTLGENTSDNGGLRLGYMALMDSLPAGEAGKKIDGFTPAQRFFISYAQVWCQNVTDQESRRRVLIDPHSPGKFRVIGAVSNSPDFATAFSCKEGDPMAPANACRVW